MSFSMSSGSVHSASTTATTLTLSSCPLSTVPLNGVGQNHGWQIGLPSDGVRNENVAGTRPLFLSVSSRRTGWRYLMSAQSLKRTHLTSPKLRSSSTTMRLGRYISSRRSSSH